MFLYTLEWVDQKVLLKRSLVAGKVPVASAMTEGELFMNIASGDSADNFLSTVRAGKNDVIQFMDKKYNEKTFALKSEVENTKSELDKLIDEVEETELVVAHAYNQIVLSTGLDEEGLSTLPGGVSLTEAIVALQNEGGPQGPQGPQGAQGAQGPAGPNFTVSTATTKQYLLGISSTTGNINTSKTHSSVYMSGGSLYATSDITLKTHIEDVDGNPEKIKLIPKVIFHWKNDEDKKRVMGTYAQNIEEIYPELVSIDSKNMRGVAYDRMGIVALAGIDKLYEMIQNLQCENKELRKRIESLEK